MTKKKASAGKLDFDLSQKAFNRVRALVKQRSGIDLGDGHATVVVRAPSLSATRKYFWPL